jgi:hypothetical protein
MTLVGHFHFHHSHPSQCAFGDYKPFSRGIIPEFSIVQIGLETGYREGKLPNSKASFSSRSCRFFSRARAAYPQAWEPHASPRCSLPVQRRPGGPGLLRLIGESPNQRTGGFGVPEPPQGFHGGLPDTSILVLQRANPPSAASPPARTGRMGKKTERKRLRGLRIRLQGSGAWRWWQHALGLLYHASREYPRTTKPVSRKIPGRSCPSWMMAMSILAAWKPCS